MDWKVISEISSLHILFVLALASLPVIWVKIREERRLKVLLNSASRNKETFKPRKGSASKPVSTENNPPDITINAKQPHPNIHELTDVVEDEVDLKDQAVTKRLMSIPIGPPRQASAGEVMVTARFVKSGLTIFVIVPKTAAGVATLYVTSGGQIFVLKRKEGLPDKVFLGQLTRSIKSTLRDFLNGKLSEREMKPIHDAVLSGKMTRRMT